MSSQRVGWGMGWGGPLHTLEIPEYKTLQMHRLHMYIVPTPRFIKKIDIFATKDELSSQRVRWGEPLHTWRCQNTIPYKDIGTTKFTCIHW